jgi:DNA replication protein DnaC
MMTIDQREKQTRLQARMDELRAEMDELRAEIAFAQKGEKPWPYRSCLMREGHGYCEKHGKYRTHILGHTPPAEAEKAYYASIGNDDLAA